MDFQQLLAKMVELDRPVSEAPLQDGGCGMPPPMSTPPPVAPPSMSVNINAQGLNNIEDMMRLFQKVNPDMLNPKEPMPMPSLGAPPSIMSIKPSMPPLKMLPDFDADNDDKIGGEIDLPPMHDKDHEMIKKLDKDDDGDHDMDDHDMEKKKETYANEPDPETKSIDYMNNQLAGGLNRPKDTFPKVADGDNPMQRVKESGDLRAQIRAELLQRLSEGKASNLEEGPMDFIKKAGSAVKGAFKGAVTGAKKSMATPGGGKPPAKQGDFSKIAKPPASDGAGVSPAQAAAAGAAQQSSEVDITPELGNELSTKLQQMANDIADGAYPNIKNVKEMMNSYLDKISKQAAKTNLGAK